MIKRVVGKVDIPFEQKKMPSEVRQSQQAFGGFIYEEIAGWEAERAKGVDLKSLE